VTKVKLHFGSQFEAYTKEFKIQKLQMKRGTPGKAMQLDEPDGLAGRLSLEFVHERQMQTRSMNDGMNAYTNVEVELDDLMMETP